MRWLAVVLVWSRVALADSPRTIERAPDRAEVGRGHLALRLLRGTAVEGGRAVFDWGTARFVLAVYERNLQPGPGLRRAIMADLSRERLEASVAPLDLAKPLVGFDVVPRRRPGPDELIYGAYVAGPDGNVAVLAFYVDDGGLADLGAWTEVARDIVATAAWSAQDAMNLGAFRAELPATASHTRHSLTVPREGSCMIGRGDGAQTAPIGTERVPGHLLGKQVTWYVGESVALAAIGDVSVVCDAVDARGLAYVRYLAERLAPIDL